MVRNHFSSTAEPHWEILQPKKRALRLCGWHSYSRTFKHPEFSLIDEFNETRARLSFRCSLDSMSEGNHFLTSWHSKQSYHTSLTLESYHLQTAAPNLPSPVSIRNAKTNLLFRPSHHLSIPPDHPKSYRSANCKRSASACKGCVCCLLGSVYSKQSVDTCR